MLKAIGLVFHHKNSPETQSIGAETGGTADKKARNAEVSGRAGSRRNPPERIPSFIRTVPSTLEFHQIMRSFMRSWVITTDRELGFSSLTLPRRLNIHLWLSIDRAEKPVKRRNVIIAR